MEVIEDLDNTDVACENCQKTFPPKSIFCHIGHNKKCKAFYGVRFDEMKKQQSREKTQRKRKRNGIEKELKSQGASYATNPLKRRKKQDYYQKM